MYDFGKVYKKIKTFHLLASSGLFNGLNIHTYNTKRRITSSELVKKGS